MLRDYLQHFSGACNAVALQEREKNVKVAPHGFKKIFAPCIIKKCCSIIVAKSNRFEFGGVLH